MTSQTAELFLERRKAELMAGESVVPLDYNELKEIAHKNLPQDPYDHVAGGAGSEETMRENQASFGRYRIIPRVLRDISERNLKTELFNSEIAAPLVLAPISSHQNYHEEGELATVRAASDLNVPLALSTKSTCSIEEVADANNGGSLFFQLYWPKDWKVAASFVKRAEEAGYDGLIVTVDSQGPGKWLKRSLQNSFSSKTYTPNAVFESDPVVQNLAKESGQSIQEYVRSAERLEKDPSLTWDDLNILREWTNLPIILKGILSPQDAHRAVQCGVDGIIVSNHGGRQIEGEVSALDQLPSIAKVADDDMTILMDSGIRSGADIFKALALGADAVQFGRPYIFGLAIAGERGVYETVGNCLAELESIMGLSGYTSIAEIDTEAIKEYSMYGPTIKEL